METKQFRDPVHGYIEIPDEFCRKYVDTDLFQRLRFIEQSSMRMLYPAARHDRFVHSLGVYSIAKRVWDNIEPSFMNAFKGRATINKYKETFLVAALLHDCAHSPFSHTGELIAKKYCNSDIETKLLKTVRSQDFRSDFYGDDRSVSYSTHEMASAYVGCRRFAAVFGRTVDREQFARMIIGLKNKQDQSKKKLAYNCLISLVNGFIVDVDRLDYLQRDTWATGICNASVDVDRLIAGIEVNIAEGKVGIKHTSLSSIVNAVAARDFIFQWVITHHIVVYANEIIRKAIENLIEALSQNGSSKAKVGACLFSPDRLLVDGKTDINGECIHLPTDGDILYLMKKYIPDDKYYKAYINREKVHVSLWKTHAEFVNIFTCGARLCDLDVLKDSKFWEVFAGRLEKFTKSHTHCFCTKPEEIKMTKHRIRKLDANIEKAISSEIIGRKTLDLTFLFGNDEKNTQFSFNAFVESEYVDSDEDGASATIKELRELLARSVDEFAENG